MLDLSRKKDKYSEGRRKNKSRYGNKRGARRARERREEKREEAREKSGREGGGACRADVHVRAAREERGCLFYPADAADERTTV